MKRVEFRLTMPGVASWNGRWSGEDKRHIIVRPVPESRILELGLPRTFDHAWDDGWRASVSARVLAVGERPGKSDGFAGYGWMVDNIITYGSTNSCPPCVWAPDASWAGYEKCGKCGTSRKLAAALRGETLTQGGT